MRILLCVAALGMMCLGGCQMASLGVGQERYDALRAQDQGSQAELAKVMSALNDANAKLAQAKGTPADGSDKNEPVAMLAVVEPRKVVYTGTLTVVVREVSAALDSAKALIEPMGGYVQRMTTEQIVLRVPAEKFEAALQAVGKLGWVTGRDIVSEDVGERYTDLEIRIKNAKALRDRLAQLVEKNSNQKEIVEMEQELSKVMTQMEELEAQMARLKNQVAYATLTVKFAAQPQSLPPELRVQLPFPWLHTLGLSTLFAFNGRNLY